MAGKLPRIVEREVAMESEKWVMDLPVIYGRNETNQLGDEQGIRIESTVRKDGGHQQGCLLAR
jgi:hypothetical protein